METIEAAIKSAPVPFRERLGCTIDEAACVSGLKRTKIYEMISVGAIKSRKVGKRRIVDVPSLIALING